MAQSTPDQPATDKADKAPAGGLAGLARMSTTAGVGLQDYRAVSPLAVAAAVCGAAAWVALLHPLGLIVPLLAVGLGVAALMGVRRSVGTQGGLALAVVGLLLGAGLGGYAIFQQVSGSYDRAAQRRDVDAALAEFGRALAAGDVRAAYGLTGEGFQREFDFAAFEERLAGFERAYGGFESARGNELADVARDAQTGQRLAEAMLIVEVEAADEAVRQTVRLSREPGQAWRIEEFGLWFPRERRRGR